MGEYEGIWKGLKSNMLELNQIYYGDYLDFVLDIPSKSVDMILTDPNYGITAYAQDKAPDLHRMWAELSRIGKSNCAYVFTSAQPFTSDLINSNRKYFKYELIWEKTSPTNYLNAKIQPLRAHENIIVFYDKQPTYNPQKTIGHERKVSTARHRRNCKKTFNYREHGLATYDSTERYPKSVLSFKSDKQKSAIHHNQKPVALFEYLIYTYSNEGDTIFDGFSGSGTTAIACINTNRNYICIEKDFDYWLKSVERVEDYMDKKGKE